MDVKQLVRKTGLAIQKNSPYILSGFGAAGVVATAIMTGKAVLKANQIIYDHDDLMTMRLSNEELKERSETLHVGSATIYESTMKEKVQLTWKCYISPVLMGTASIACIFGACSVNSKRYAALASLYSLTENTLNDYKQKVVEKIGEKKEAEISAEVAQKRLNDNPKSSNQVIITGKGETLCYDTLSGRYFKHDIESLRRIQNDLNHDLMGQMWVPLNDLYLVLGLKPVKMGEEMGWTVDELLEFKFSTMLSDDNQPCLVLDYSVTPKYVHFS